MRKILLSLLIVTLTVAMFGVVANATDNTYDVYFTDPVIDYDNNTAIAYLVLAPQTNGLFAMTFEKEVTGATVKLSDTNALKALDATMTLDEMTLFGFTSGDAGISETTEPINVVKFDITREAGANTAIINIKKGEFMDANGEDVAIKIKSLTFSWEKSTPKAEIDTAADKKGTTAVGDNGITYTNVPTYIGKVSASNVDGKSVKITPVVKYNGTDVTSTLKKVDSIIIPGASFDKGAKIEFKFAIVGAPTTGTIDLSATAVPVE